MAADAPPTSIHDVSDDVLELILQRVSSLVYLVRAASACKLWRRVVADSGFRWLHAPAIAGYYNKRRWFDSMKKKPWTTSIQPSFDAMSSTVAGIDPRYLSLDFLSDVTSGLHEAEILDSRGSLLLVEFRGEHAHGILFPEALVVCEPLTRQYKKIPRPQDYDGDPCYYWGSFLIDGDGDEDKAVGGRRISMTNFRVLCEIDRDHIAHTMVFTADGSEDSWIEKPVNHIIPKLNLSCRRILGRAGGSWYFYIDELQGSTWFVLDGSTGEYSSAQLLTTVDWDLHNSRWKHNFYVTDGCDGKPRVVSLLDDTLKVFARIDGSNDGEWALEKRMNLPESLCGLLGPHYEPPSLYGFVNIPNGTWDLSLWAKGPGFIIVKLGAFAATHLRRFFSVNLHTMEVKPAEMDQYDILYQCTLPCPPAALHSCIDTS